MLSLNFAYKPGNMISMLYYYSCKKTLKCKIGIDFRNIDLNIYLPYEAYRKNRHTTAFRHFKTKAYNYMRK